MRVHRHVTGHRLVEVVLRTARLRRIPAIERVTRTRRIGRLHDLRTVPHLLRGDDRTTIRIKRHCDVNELPALELYRSIHIIVRNAVVEAICLDGKQLTLQTGELGEVDIHGHTHITVVVVSATHLLGLSAETHRSAGNRSGHRDPNGCLAWHLGIGETTPSGATVGGILGRNHRLLLVFHHCCIGVDQTSTAVFRAIGRSHQITVQLLGLLLQQFLDLSW